MSSKPRELDTDVEFVGYVPVVVHLTETHLKMLDMMKAEFEAGFSPCTISRNTLLMQSIEMKYDAEFPDDDAPTITEPTAG